MLSRGKIIPLLLRIISMQAFGFIPPNIRLTEKQFICMNKFIIFAPTFIGIPLALFIMTEVYRPSGKFLGAAFLYFILVAIIAIPILAIIYTFAIWYIPIIYFNILLTIGFGLMIGYVISRFVIQPGKLRNPGLAAILALLGGLLAIYYNYVLWADLTLNASGEVIGGKTIGIVVSTAHGGEVWQLLLNPKALIGYIQEINAVGTWGIKGNTVHGTFLYIIWAVEAILVIGIPIILCHSRAAEPFCEEGNRWAEKKELPGYPYIEDKDAFIAALRNKEFKLEEDQFLPVNTTDPHVAIILYHSDHDNYYLTAINKLPKTDRKGKITFTNQEIFKYLRLHTEIGKYLKTI